MALIRIIYLVMMGLSKDRGVDIIFIYSCLNGVQRVLLHHFNEISLYFDGALARVLSSQVQVATNSSVSVSLIVYVKS